jgi:vacuolar protein sorting-associated protein 45
MIDELIGIEDNFIKEHSFGNENPEILARESGDNFLDMSWSLNFGDAGNELSSRLDNEKKNRNIDLKGSNLDDLQEIMSKMPEMKKKLKELRKHSDIFKFLNKELEERDLFKLSGIQQDISTENKKTDHFATVIETLSDKSLAEDEKIKLCLLFALKYSDDKDRINGMKSTMRKKSIQTQHVDKVLNMARSESRKTDDFFSKGSKFFKKAASGIVTKLKDFQDSPHYFERHKPRCVLLAKQLFANKLASSEFPQIEPMGYNKPRKNSKSKNLVIFIVGGASY